MDNCRTQRDEHGRASGRHSWPLSRLSVAMMSVATLLLCAGARSAFAAAPPLSPSPKAVSFGTVTVGAPEVTMPLTLTNSSKSSVTIGTIAISGTGFKVVSDACSTKTIDTGDQCALSLGFAPTAAGKDSGKLSIPSNASTKPVTVTLKGAAVLPVLTLSATKLKFPSVGVGSTSALPVTLKNGTTAPISITAIAASGSYTVPSGQ